MTCKELMDQLLQMPSDANIYIDTEQNVFIPVKTKLWIDPDNKNIYECSIYAEE